VEKRGANNYCGCKTIRGIFLHIMASAERGRVRAEYRGGFIVQGGGRCYGRRGPTDRSKLPTTHIAYFVWKRNGGGGGRACNTLAI